MFNDGRTMFPTAPRSTSTVIKLQQRYNALTRTRVGFCLDRRQGVRFEGAF